VSPASRGRSEAESLDGAEASLTIAGVMVGNFVTTAAETCRWWTSRRPVSERCGQVLRDEGDVLTYLDGALRYVVFDAPHLARIVMAWASLVPTSWRTASGRLCGM
jgi:hypothetical protein